MVMKTTRMMKTTDDNNDDDNNDDAASERNLGFVVGMHGVFPRAVALPHLILLVRSHYQKKQKMFLQVFGGFCVFLVIFVGVRGFGTFSIGKSTTTRCFHADWWWEDSIWSKSS